MNTDQILELLTYGPLWLGGTLIVVVLLAAVFLNEAEKRERREAMRDARARGQARLAQRQKDLFDLDDVTFDWPDRDAA